MSILKTHEKLSKSIKLCKREVEWADITVRIDKPSEGWLLRQGVQTKRFYDWKMFEMISLLFCVMIIVCQSWSGSSWC